MYCSVSAFGRTGPRKDGAGYEALMQAFSGIMSITGEPGGPPVRAGVSFLDLTTGIFCAFGIVNALLHRVSTGLGQRVDGSLLETAVTLLNYHAEGYPVDRRAAQGARLVASVALAVSDLQVRATASGCSSPAPTIASGSAWRRRSAWGTWPRTRASP